jgi:hypothetical protein
MKKIMNESVKEIIVETKISPKTQNEYTVIEITFKNGYTFQAFLKEEQRFIISSLDGKEVA